MKNSVSQEMFQKIGKMGGVSTDLKFLHDEVIYTMDLDSHVFSPKYQNALYTLSKIIEAFQSLESELFPSESEDVKLLKAQISELQKSNEALTLNLKDNRSFIEQLELQLKR